ncbi:uncharacterized protein LOC114366635 isoform X2 [Ostrinia furnacalis]|uniref:uncharacterized protein LOC114366635 isoform X2 n=1 Tax=Ostrinia furnacalis TaxID=93504 RepID=UPI00103E0C51|nr:uncharacterized protein LOC114366635 isoform X2 [Ostrinia furnacalis]
MFLGMLVQSKTTIKALNRYSVILPHRLFSQALDNTYTEQQKEKILQVINEADNNMLSRYEIPKSRIKKVSQWKDTYGGLKSISDIHLIDGFSDKSAKKLFDSILDGPSEPPTVPKASSKIKGQILQPTLNESTRQAWKVTHKLPQADIYVMKAEATTLRAGGSDPNNPKVIAVNLQKSQMISMIVALINARSNQITVAQDDEEEETSQIEKNFKHKVYFLRPSLPYRLYGTLVGNERVSTDQTVEMMLQNMSARSTENFLPKAYISEELKSDFRSRNELERDMLGHCLLLTLTFMDLCIYKNQESIQKLNKRGE